MHFGTWHLTASQLLQHAVLVKLLPQGSSVLRIASSPDSLLDESAEMKLHGYDRAEKKLWGLRADVYACLVALEGLEEAYINGAFSSDEAKRDYAGECQDLINSMKMRERQLQDADGHSISDFIRVHNLKCQQAQYRLGTGVPATVEMRSHSRAQDTNHGVLALQAGRAFVEAADYLDMNMVDKEGLFQPLQEILSLLNRMTSLPADFGPISKMNQWVGTVNQMGMYAQLSEEQIRQLKFDLDDANRDLERFLQGTSSGGGGGTMSSHGGRPLAPPRVSTDSAPTGGMSESVLAGALGASPRASFGTADTGGRDLSAAGAPSVPGAQDAEAGGGVAASPAAGDSFGSSNRAGGEGGGGEGSGGPSGPARPLFPGF